MENLEGGGGKKKISDSAYSNSPSQRSRSSKSTHSASHSSASSGYGGKPTEGSSGNEASPPTIKRVKEKDQKKKRRQLFVPPTIEEATNPCQKSYSPTPENAVEIIEHILNPPAKVDYLYPDCQQVILNTELVPFSDNTELKQNGSELVLSKAKSEKFYADIHKQEGFSCVVSMQDGVIMYTTSSLTCSLGFPKDMWIGRSFIDFVHPNDCTTFVSKITAKVGLPLAGTSSVSSNPALPRTSLFCRLRRYRGLRISGFAVKEREEHFIPFKLHFSVRDLNAADDKGLYLVVIATPVVSLYKHPKEKFHKPASFMIRHAAVGTIDHVDDDSVGFLGYLPHEIIGKCILDLYHPEDVPYLSEVYHKIARHEIPFKSRPYRFLAQNGDFVIMETDWTSFVNPWSRKLEFVIGHHHVLEGPAIPNIFEVDEDGDRHMFTDIVLYKAKQKREEILKTMNEVLTKPSAMTKQLVNKRCQDVAAFMENLMEDSCIAPDDEVRLELAQSFSERDSVMLGGMSPHHDYYDSKSTTEAPPSYTVLNYNDNLNRFFESNPSTTFDELMQLPLTSDYDDSMQLTSPDSPINTRRCLSPVEEDLAISEESLALYPDMEFGARFLLTGESTYYKPIHLSETIMKRHDIDMEKRLIKRHREDRCSSKGEKNSGSYRREKKKEHLERCTASFNNALAIEASDESSIGSIYEPNQPIEKSSHESNEADKENRNKATRSNKYKADASSEDTIDPVAETSDDNSAVAESSNEYSSVHGVKREGANSLKSAEDRKVRKHDYSSMLINQQPTTSSYKIAVSPPGHKLPATDSSTRNISLHSASYIGATNLPMPENQVHVPVMPAISGTPGIAPMCYAPPQLRQVMHQPAHALPTPYPFQYIMCPPPVFAAQPYIYSPILTPMTYSTMAADYQQNIANKQLGLAYANYQQALMHTRVGEKKNMTAQMSMPAANAKVASGMADNLSSQKSYSDNVSAPKFTSRRNQLSSTEYSGNSGNSRRHFTRANSYRLRKGRLNAPSAILLGGHESESSYSSFYSSLLRTDTGSFDGNNRTQDFGKKKYYRRWRKFKCTKTSQAQTCARKNHTREIQSLQKEKHALETDMSLDSESDRRDLVSGSEFETNTYTEPRNVNPPWLEKVSVTSDLVYRYQIEPKNNDEVLIQDLAALRTMMQPNLVNEQLSQLYADLQLIGFSPCLFVMTDTDDGSGFVKSGDEDYVIVDEEIFKVNRYDDSSLMRMFEEDALWIC